MKKVALIISVYKNTRDLEVVLRSLEQQSYKDVQVIISEDGNSNEMKEFVTNYKGGLDLNHLTQEDVGWRKNIALNNAIKYTDCEYIIFIDGDCVLHPEFIENHVLFAQRDRVLAGKRIKLGPKYSEELRLSKNIANFCKRILPEFSFVKKDDAKFCEEGIYISPRSVFSFIPKLRKMKQLKGCNFSCYKSALEAINGFDEDYILPAIGEDIDLTWRFKGMGYKLFSLRNFAVQYHLHHKENWTDQSENERIMFGKIKENQFVAKNGLLKINV
ncbi:MAG TPA: glycosyltransferase [Flavobacterium sp.]|nr:glycosyltransferase [Flavobacterium sp.]